MKDIIEIGFNKWEIIMAEQTKQPKWLKYLSEEDLAFIKRFVLASGSLKEMAKQYGITYPTVRLRLDRLIEKIKLVESREPMSEFELLARSLYVEGKLDIYTLKTLLEAYKKERQEENERNNISR